MADAQDVLPRSADIFDDIRALKSEQEALRKNLAELESRLEKELQREDQKIKGDIDHLKKRALCCPPTVTTVTPSGRLGSHLHLSEDSEYISSCFYSHPLGYKLCLALKSKKIDLPDIKHPVRKTNLQISLLAVDDGIDRIWPFEGTIIMRIRDSPIVSAPLSFKFSIREPISESDIDVHEKKLPESLKWTCIPEQCNPYHRKYEELSFPTPLCGTPIDLPYFTRIPYITRNFQGAVHFQIEYISRVSEKGSKEKQSYEGSGEGTRGKIQAGGSPLLAAWGLAAFQHSSRKAWYVTKRAHPDLEVKSWWFYDLFIGVRFIPKSYLQ